MPSRHSKNSGDRHHFTHHERHKAGMGSLKQRLGVESQLPFGYCALSMYPIEDAVASPSGHLYSRESIFEYLLSKSKELKRQQELYEEQQRRLEEEQRGHLRKLKDQQAEQFLQATDGIASVAKRTREDVLESSEYFKSRKKIIDDTEKDIRIEELKRVAPWVPQFTPEAKETMIKQPPKRPPSPFSGRPLRAKDLIPVDLMREPEGDDSKTRFLCPVSRKTITNQKVILIKTTGTYMLEEVAKELAFPSMTCPITGRPFTQSDVLELVQAKSAFSATGDVEAKVHRPTIN